MALKLATMVPNAAPNAPASAEILPPPGAALSLAVSFTKPRTVMFTNLEAPASLSRYSMIFFSGSNALSSVNPRLLTAHSTNSLSLTPLLNPCFSKKYFPASNKGCKGIRPTNSEPVTRTPRSSAAFRVSSKATCKGVIL